MRKFLSQFLDNVKVEEIEAAYKQKNPDSSELPTYIPKTRLDDEIGKRKDAETKLKAVPEDWKTQLEEAKKAVTDTKTEYEGKLAEAKKSAENDLLIYKSGARNITAVKALIDSSKPVEEQLTALKTSDPYLFAGNGGMGKGTGKGDDSHGGDGDDGGKPEDKLSTAAMYRAVGLTPPTE